MDEDFLIKDTTFLDTLRDRLNRGNKRSIHLNALPGNSATRVDLVDISLISRDFPEKFLSLLLSKDNFKIEISFPDNFELNTIDEKEQKSISVAVKRLKNISKQNNDYFLEHGIKPFGFGYPIIYKRDKQDPNSIIKAPLLIWNLEIEQDLRKINKWIIKRGEDFPIYINDVLISHIEKDENIKIERLSSEYLSDSIIDNNELIEIATNILYQFGSKVESSRITDSLQKIFKADSLKSKEDLISNIPSLISAGVFGLYLNQKQSIIEDYKLFLDNSTDNIEDNLIFEKVKVNPFASIETDPSQQSILASLSKSKRIIIQGPPGTGKSQTLTAIITNALSNELKCLIVCEKITALEVIHNNLKKIGLDSLCALIEDTAKDRRKIVDAARETVDNVNKTTYYKKNFNFDKDNYLTKLDKAKALSTKINEFHSFLHEPLFYNMNWTNIVGLRLKNKDESILESINKSVDKNQLFLSNNEYLRFRSIIIKAKSLATNKSKFDSLLSTLNYDFFKSKGIIEIKSEINEFLKTSESEASSIKENLELQIKLYINQLNTDFNSYLSYLKNLINENERIFDKNKNSKLFINNHIIALYLLSKINLNLRT